MERIEFETAQGTERAVLALPEGGSGPGLLLLHAWWGLTPFFEGLAERLAAEGFVTLAPDLFGGPTAGSIEEAEALVQGSEGAATWHRAAGALESLRQHPATRGEAVGIVGFSFGAAWALELAAALGEQVAAVVLFYGSYEPDLAHARAAFLGHFAEGDEWEPDDGRGLEAALREAGREVTFHRYPGVAHWFFEDNRPEFDAETARIAWERTLAFLRRHLPGTEPR